MDFEDFKRYWRNSYIGIPTKEGTVMPFKVEVIDGNNVMGHLLKDKGSAKRPHVYEWKILNNNKTIFKPPPPGMINDKKGVTYLTTLPMRQWHKGVTMGNGRMRAHLPYSHDFIRATGMLGEAIGSDRMMWEYYNPSYFDITKLEGMLQRGTRFGGAITHTMALIMSEKTPHSVLLYKETEIGEYRDGIIHLYQRMMPYADHVKRELRMEVLIDG